MPYGLNAVGVAFEHCQKTFLEENSDTHTHTHSLSPTPTCTSLTGLICSLFKSTCSVLHSLCLSPARLRLPLPPSRHTHTSSSSSFFLSLISQGSTPACLLFLLAAYFARGPFPFSHLSLLRFFLSPFHLALSFLHLSAGKCRSPCSV